MSRFAVGVDEGGTEIAAGVVGSDGILLSSVHDPIEMYQDDPGVTVRQIARLVGKAEMEASSIAEAHLTGLPVGIGIPCRRQVVRVVPAALGPSAGIIGAAKIALDSFGR